MEKLVVVIGLPRSGKSTFCQTLDNYILFDDFLQNYYNGKLLDTIKNKPYVCINDPRLCNYKTFERIMKDILEITYNDKIELVLFENNKEHCLLNSEDKRRDNDIVNLSKFYDINNYTSYNHKIIPVYQKNLLFNS